MKEAIERRMYSQKRASTDPKVQSVVVDSRKAFDDQSGTLVPEEKSPSWKSDVVSNVQVKGIFEDKSSVVGRRLTNLQFRRESRRPPVGDNIHNSARIANDGDETYMGDEYQMEKDIDENDDSDEDGEDEDYDDSDDSDDIDDREDDDSDEDDSDDSEINIYDRYDEEKNNDVYDNDEDVVKKYDRSKISDENYLFDNQIDTKISHQSTLNRNNNDENVISQNSYDEDVLNFLDGFEINSLLYSSDDSGHPELEFESDYVQSEGTEESQVLNIELNVPDISRSMRQASKDGSFDKYSGSDEDFHSNSKNSFVGKNAANLNPANQKKIESKSIRDVVRDTVVEKSQIKKHLKETDLMKLRQKQNAELLNRNRQVKFKNVLPVLNQGVGVLKEGNFISKDSDIIHDSRNVMSIPKITETKIETTLKIGVKRDLGIVDSISRPVNEEYLDNHEYFSGTAQPESEKQNHLQEDSRFQRSVHDDPNLLNEMQGSGAHSGISAQSSGSPPSNSEDTLSRRSVTPTPHPEYHTESSGIKELDSPDLAAIPDSVSSFGERNGNQMLGQQQYEESTESPTIEIDRQFTQSSHQFEGVTHPMEDLGALVTEDYQPDKPHTSDDLLQLGSPFPVEHSPPIDVGSVSADSELPSPESPPTIEEGIPAAPESVLNYIWRFGEKYFQSPPADVKDVQGKLDNDKESDTHTAQSQDNDIKEGMEPEQNIRNKDDRKKGRDIDNDKGTRNEQKPHGSVESVVRLIDDSSLYSEEQQRQHAVIDADIGGNGQKELHSGHHNPQETHHHLHNKDVQDISDDHNTNQMLQRDPYDKDQHGDSAPLEHNHTIEHHPNHVDGDHRAFQNHDLKSEQNPNIDSQKPPQDQSHLSDQHPGHHPRNHLSSSEQADRHLHENKHDSFRQSQPIDSSNLNVAGDVPELTDGHKNNDFEGQLLDETQQRPDQIPSKRDNDPNYVESVGESLHHNDHQKEDEQKKDNDGAPSHTHDQDQDRKDVSNQEKSHDYKQGQDTDNRIEEVVSNHVSEPEPQNGDNRQNYTPDHMQNQNIIPKQSDSEKVGSPSWKEEGFRNIQQSGDSVAGDSGEKKAQKVIPSLIQTSNEHGVVPPVEQDRVPLESSAFDEPKLTNKDNVETMYSSSLSFIGGVYTWIKSLSELVRHNCFHLKNRTRYISHNVS